MIKILLLISSVVLFAANYESGKIDMHGGNESYSFTKKKGEFKKSIACMSDFLDRNTSNGVTSKGK